MRELPFTDSSLRVPIHYDVLAILGHEIGAVVIRPTPFGYIKDLYARRGPRERCFHPGHVFHVARHMHRPVTGGGLPGVLVLIRHFLTRRHSVSALNPPLRR